MIEPQDSFKVMCAYPVAKDDEEFMLLLNYWLEMEESYGGLKRKYDYWIMGEGLEENGHRWSVARDVLHLID